MKDIDNIIYIFMALISPNSIEIFFNTEDFKNGYLVVGSDLAGDLRSLGIHNYDRMTNGSSVSILFLFNNERDVSVEFFCKKINAIEKEYRLSLSKNISPTDGGFFIITADQDKLKIEQSKISKASDILLSREQNINTPRLSNGDNYPDKLVDWAGSSKGGVRIVFGDNNGRPVRTQIKTTLVKMAEDLASEIVSGKKKPRLIMFAGGAGNGKTDTLEVILSGICLPSKLKEFKEEVRLQLSQSRRKVVLSPKGKDKSFFPQPICDFYEKISFVQDASESYESIDSPSAQLASDLDSLNENSTQLSELIILCVNRGVLYTAAKLVKDPTILNRVLKAIDPINVDIDCWPVQPMENYIHENDFYLWPLDIDSICVSQSQDPSPVEQVLADLNSRDWSQIEVFSEIHPLVHSRRLLAKPEFRSAFSKLLREYELVSGKNFNFRKLFSVLSYLFTGGSTPTATLLPSVSCGSSSLPPQGNNIEKLQDSFAIYRHSMPYLLFPTLPNFDRLESHVNRLSIKEGHPLNILVDFIKKESQLSKRSTGFPGAEIFTDKKSEWSTLIDPAQSEGISKNPLFSDVESDLCLGLDCLEEKYFKFIDPASKALLSRIILISEELGSFAANKQNSDSDCKWIYLWIIRWASVIVKRSIFVYLLSEGESCTGNASQLKAFYEAEHESDDDPQGYVDSANRFLFVPAVNNGAYGNEDYVVQLAKGLCQPYSNGLDGASLGIKNLNFSSVLLTEKKFVRPKGSLLIMEFKLGSVSVRLPVTMSMHDFMQRSKRGELYGSMPAALRGVVDTFRLQLDGLALRDASARFKLYLDRKSTEEFRLNNITTRSGRARTNS